MSAFFVYQTPECYCESLGRNTTICLAMDHPDVSVRCQRCGSQMDLKDPGPEDPWPPQQFWECPQCSRHFWTTYPPVKPAKPAPKPRAEAPAAEQEGTALHGTGPVSPREAKPPAPDTKIPTADDTGTP